MTVEDTAVSRSVRQRTDVGHSGQGASVTTMRHGALPSACCGSHRVSVFRFFELYNDRSSCTHSSHVLR